MLTLSESTRLPMLHVEACLLPTSTSRYDLTRRHIESFLRSSYPSVILNTKLSVEDFVDSPFLKENVDFLRICEIRGGEDTEVHKLANCQICIHVFQLNEEEGVDEVSEEDHVVTSNHWVLPARGLQGLWDSLIYDNNIQLQLLDYVYTSMLFGDKNVDPNIVSVNRVALLHGPPGTGKTSLCRALAQKLAIRLADRYSYGKLVEINSHSLFSKFFSESGKLVQKMFAQIHLLLDDEDAFVCVLIDEVESLSAARKAALSGMEPSDAIRVVNALLTQLDQLRQRKNVLILTTSNITEAIDLAFIDRADIKQYIGPPSRRARYAILVSCMNELAQKGLITRPSTPLIDHREIELWSSSTMSENREESLLLYQVADACEGFSGRTLRKLPFLAHAFHLNSETSSMKEYICGLARTVERERGSRGYLSKGS